MHPTTTTTPRRASRSLARGVTLVVASLGVMLGVRSTLGPPRPDQAEVRRAESHWPQTFALPSLAPSNATFLWTYTWERSGLIYPWWEDHQHSVFAASDSGAIPAALAPDQLRSLNLRGFQDSIGAANLGPLRELSPWSSYIRGSTHRRILTAGIIADALVASALVAGGFGLHTCVRVGVDAFRSRRRVRRGLCPNCAYPTPATGTVCPECGGPIARNPEPPR